MSFKTRLVFPTFLNKFNQARRARRKVALFIFKKPFNYVYMAFLKIITL